LITDLVIVDNALRNPQRLVELAKQQEFLTCDKHKLTTVNVKWAGYRTKLIHEMDKHLLNETVMELMDSVFKKTFGDSSIKHEFNSMVTACFHVLTRNEQQDDSWFHTDKECAFAGILYLNENPEKDSGTTVLTNDGEILVENKFNRFVIYRADYFHAAQGGFGDDVSDGRLTANFFLHQLDLRMART
jgi:hypothetical protein